MEETLQLPPGAMPMCGSPLFEAQRVNRSYPLRVAEPMQAETSNRWSRGEPKDEVVPLQVGVTWSNGPGLAFYIA